MLEHAKQTAIDLAVQFGPRVLVAFALIAFGVLAARWAARTAERGLRKFRLEPPMRQLTARLASLLVVGLFVIMALQNLGVELLPLLAGLGLAGAGVALAMQGVLSNVVAGLTVIFTRPFHVGEYISIVGEEGLVESISLFNTVLGHTDKSLVVIPNRKIVGEILHNYGKIRQVNLVASIAREADLHAALAAINDVLNRSAWVLKDPASVVLVGLPAAAAIDIALKPWVNVPDYERAGSDLAAAIVETFRARNIPLPTPQRDVRLLGGGAAAAADVRAFPPVELASA